MQIPFSADINLLSLYHCRAHFPAISELELLARGLDTVAKTVHKRANVAAAALTLRTKRALDTVAKASNICGWRVYRFVCVWC